MRTIKYLIYIALSVASVGCGHRVVQPRIESLKIDTLFNEGETAFEISYDFATISNACRSEALAAIEQANILYFFGQEAFEGSAREAARAAVDEFREVCADSFRGEWTASLSVLSEAETVDSLLVYTIFREEYTGGAHGMRSVECHNYSIVGGYELASGDLFTPRQAAAAAVLIRRKLYEMFRVEDDEGLTAVGFFPEQIALTENFRIMPQGITFVYNPYDIACYAVGGVEVSISNEELASLRQKH